MIEYYFYKNRLKPMSEKNTGVPYEMFVQDLMQTIIDADGKVGQRNIEVKHNVKLKDKFGNERQFDVYWEYELGGVVYKTVIECKDYTSKITVEKIDALIGKLKDFPDLKGLFATTKGYQSGAEKKANDNSIDLLKINHIKNFDFKSPKGEPLIKSIVGNIIAIQSAKIICFETYLDMDWLKENTKLDLEKPIPRGECLNINTFIHDIENDKRYSLRDLEHTLSGEYDKELEQTKMLKNAFVEFPNGEKFKLKGYKIKYIIPSPIKSTIEVSAEDIYEGVIEYLSSGKMKFIAKDGTIKDV